MSINLLSNIKISQFKIYSVKSKNKQLINKIFDKLYIYKEIKYSKYLILHEYSMFVI